MISSIPIGYTNLIKHFQIKALPHWRESYILMQGSRKTIYQENQEIHYYPKGYHIKNPDSVFEQLEFALKYDGINLEIIKAVLANLNKKTICNYINDQPVSKFSRLIWFFYEFLLKKTLPLENLKTGNYIDLVNPTLYITALPLKLKRYRVNNNLLGNADFCPLVRKSSALKNWLKKNLAKKVDTIIESYDESLLLRAAHYLYSKETRSSYEIEHERPDQKRTARFINLLKNASGIKNLDKTALITIQNSIVEDRFSEKNYRSIQNYVGETIYVGKERLHYICPKPADVELLMYGLLECLKKLLESNLNPIIIAGIISFGFVFIHPFQDGNGRLHRFLLHYILLKTGFTPKRLIFPISASMLNKIQQYDELLESFSVPLLRLITDYILNDKGQLTVNEDTFNFYQFIDYTNITCYLFQTVEKTINTDFLDELKFLQNYDEIRSQILAVVDLPDNLLELIIKLILQNNGKLSLQKRKIHFAMLKDSEINQIEKIIKSVSFSHSSMTNHKK